MCQKIDAQMKLVEAGPNVVERLRAFREEMESDGETCLPQIVVSAALVLADLCDLFGLSAGQRREVLGRDGVQYVTDFEAIPIRLKKRANGRGRRPFAGG